MTIEEIRKLAIAVRTEIMNCRSFWPPIWSQFPKGTCGDVARILGTILDDYGYTGFDFICGEIEKLDGKKFTHAWLQKGELIVDITADQFSEISYEVIVSTESDWHKNGVFQFVHAAI